MREIELGAIRTNPIFGLLPALKTKELMPKQRLCITAMLAISLCPAVLAAQGDQRKDIPAETNASVGSVRQRSIEDLNLQGTDVSMPPFSDAIIPVSSDFRRGLASHGFAFRINSTDSYYQNTLDAPVAREQQAYIGERITWRAMLNPILTYDLRAFHIDGAQLYAAAGIQRTNWNPGGPNVLSMTSLYLFKSFAEGRVEAKLGYIGNDFEFVGMQVGGSTAGGAQGVYAVLPFEVGLSHFPQPAPSFNIKVQSPHGFYAKAAAQRSLEHNGAIATNARNSSGFRFDPKGDKLLAVFEAGYKHNPTADSFQTFVRGGYLRNTTAYANKRTGQTSTDNYCGYLLADRQFTRASYGSPGNGFYAGATAMVVPSALNIYSQYYEARLYMKGPFRSRQKDMTSLVGSHTAYSAYATRALESAGKSTWHSSTTVSGSYNLSLHAGMYLMSGLTYVAGPAVSPKASNALTLAIQLTSFF
jgi:porin